MFLSHNDVSLSFFLPPFLTLALLYNNREREGGKKGERDRQTDSMERQGQEEKAM